MWYISVEIHDPLSVLTSAVLCGGEESNDAELDHLAVNIWPLGRRHVTAS